MSERIGKFQVLGSLGSGAHSTILHIRREKDARSYALKVVKIDDAEEHKFLEQARLEFRIASMLDHPNLVKIPIYEETKDWFFRIRKVELLIEYVDGKTLDKLPVCGPDKLLPIFIQIARALEHMHNRGVFHADLKPNNIILAKSGRVKVIDYGLAWVKGEPKDRIQGTPEYMAPETSSHKTVNERSDIFNFGATMYRLTTWQELPPTVPEGGMRLDAKVWESMRKPIRECNAAIPEELAELIEKCIRFKPNGRPDNVKTIREVLEEMNEIHGDPIEE